MCSPIVVLKLGGSVLTGASAYREAAAFLADLVSDGRARAVAVVSAEQGHTDALLGEAQALADDPDQEALDLLWSTGELRSVALLTIALRAHGVPVAGFNVHETGLRVAHCRRVTEDAVDLNSLSLRVALARHAVVVVPGFLATRGQQVVTLGRGGSDCSAVLLAASLRASSCILIKDVDGYFTDDPRANAAARLMPSLSHDDALRMADAGCPLVQRQAIAEARARGVEIVVRSFVSEGTTVRAKDLRIPESENPRISESQNL